MAGTFTATVMAEGQLPSAKGTLYTVPGGSKAYIKFFSLYSPSATPQTVHIYVKPGATSRQVRRILLQQDESYDVIGKERSLELEAGDTVEGDSTSATTVDYVISGIVET